MVPRYVIPAKADNQKSIKCLDPRLHGDDVNQHEDALRIHSHLVRSLNKYEKVEFYYSSQQ